MQGPGAVKGWLSVQSALALILVVAAALLPVWSASIPPLLDYHNHLARQYILNRIDASEHLVHWYITSWHAAPYLAFDGIVQGLAAFLPVDVAGKIFLSLMLLLLGLVPLALNLAVLGRVTPVALLGLLFVHNDTVTLGFVNYLFGIGFALCVAALWIRLRLGPLRARLLLFPLLCSLIFFSHLLGFVVYALTVGSYELGRYVAGMHSRGGALSWALDRDQRWNLLSILIQCAVPLAIFAAFGPSTESVSINTYGGLGRKFGLLFGMFGYLVPPYLWTLDRAVQVALPMVLLVLLATRRLRIEPGMRWPLGAMLLLFFAMPMELFSGWGADHRLLPAMGLLLVGSLRPEAGGSRQVSRWAYAVVALLVVVRVVSVSIEWRKSDAQYAEYVRAFDAIPDGSRVYFAFGHAGGKQISTHPVYHLPTLVLAQRDVYVPYLFASSSGGFTLQYRPQVEPWQRLSRGPVLTGGASPDWAAIEDRFDYFLFVDEKHFRTPVPAGFRLVFEGRSVRMYQRLPARAPS
jgi:hypothetical protein